MWYFYNATALGYTSPFFCFVLDYLFVKQILSFLPLTLLMWAFPCVLLSHQLDSFYHGALLSSCTDYNTPLHLTTCNNPIGWHHATETFHHLHSSLYKLCIGVTGFLLDSWTLRMGPICWHKMSERNYHYSLCNNPEQHSSQGSRWKREITHTQNTWYLLLSMATMVMWKRLSVTSNIHCPSCFVNSSEYGVSTKAAFSVDICYLKPCSSELNPLSCLSPLQLRIWDQDKSIAQWLWPIVVHFISSSSTLHAIYSDGPTQLVFLDFRNIARCGES